MARTLPLDGLAVAGPFAFFRWIDEVENDDEDELLFVDCPIDMKGLNAGLEALVRDIREADALGRALIAGLNIV